MHQPPQLNERVLDGGCGQQEHGRHTNNLADTICRARVLAVLIINAIAIEAAMDAREHLMRFINDAEVERRRLAQPRKPALAAGVLTACQEYPFAVDIDVSA